MDRDLAAELSLDRSQLNFWAERIFSLDSFCPNCEEQSARQAHLHFVRAFHRTTLPFSGTSENGLNSLTQTDIMTDRRGPALCEAELMRVCANNSADFTEDFDLMKLGNVIL